MCGNWQCGLWPQQKQYFLSISWAHKTDRKANKMFEWNEVSRLSSNNVYPGKNISQKYVVFASQKMCSFVVLLFFDAVCFWVLCFLNKVSEPRHINTLAAATTHIYFSCVRFNVSCFENIASLQSFSVLLACPRFGGRPARWLGYRRWCSLYKICAHKSTREIPSNFTLGS